MPENGTCSVCTRHAILKHETCKRCRSLVIDSVAVENEEETEE